MPRRSKGPGINLEDALLQLEEITAAYAASAEHREAVLDVAKTGAEMARDLAESELTNSRRHVTKGGYVNEPGDYARSISGEAIFREGKWDGRVIARDWKSWWIEDGTEKWPKHAILRRSAAKLDDDDVEIEHGKPGE